MKIIKDILAKIIPSKKEVAVGLDIGSSSVKVVQVQKMDGSKQKELVNFAIQPFKGDKREDIVKAIRDAFARANITTTLVNTSVSGQAVIVRYVQMPKMTKEELSKAMAFQAAKYIPFNVEDVNYDFQILDQGKPQDKFMRVLLVAVKKELIDERTGILREAGLIPNVIDVDSFSIINSFQLGEKGNEGIVAVLDVGADITSTTILRDNIPYFNRDVPLGGNDLTKAITEGFEISTVEAEELKRNPQERYGELINIISPVLDSICGEIHLSFNYCESQLGGSVKKIYLTGGSAKFKGIDKVLSGILGVDVEIWDPTQMMPCSEAISKERLKEIGPLLSVSVGLALRE
ncbi:MAG: type IV pilus assembly protein PilM [Candidatus Omnitrophota bacterium]